MEQSYRDRNPAKTPGSYHRVPGGRGTGTRVPGSGFCAWGRSVQAEKEGEAVKDLATDLSKGCPGSGHGMGVPGRNSDAISH